MRYLAALLLLYCSTLAASPRFTDDASASGLDFVYDNGASPERYYPEIFGGGVALVDYDADGDLDIYLVQGGSLVSADPRPADRLYRNDLVAVGRPRFVDVTQASGLDAREYGMGVATGDYDGDGHVDLYITNFGANQLWRNQGDGTFVDVTTAAGADDPRWSVPAVFFDYDSDGKLDLFVGNYVAFSTASNRRCFGESGARDFCKPQVFEAQQDRLLRNRGAGPDGQTTFVDVSATAGLSAAFGPALGAVDADFDGNGRSDLYVANDGAENQLWMGQKDGTLVEDALLAGAALSGEGQPEGSMGVDARDVDGDGDVDLFMTHLAKETHTLYLNDGRGMFRDATLESGIAAPSFPYTGFGTAWLDVDADGQLDLLIANGAVQAIEGQRRARDPVPYREPNQLLVRADDGRYRDASAEAGDALTQAEVSRGVGIGDLDEDGDVDAVVTNNDGPVRLLINRTEPRGHYLALRLLGRAGEPALGARWGLATDDGPARWLRVRTAGSYLSASDPRQVMGLGDQAQLGAVIVEWPDGQRRRIVGLPVDVLVTVRR